MEKIKIEEGGEKLQKALKKLTKVKERNFDDILLQQKALLKYVNTVYKKKGGSPIFQ